MDVTVVTARHDRTCDKVFSSFLKTPQRAIATIILIAALSYSGYSRVHRELTERFIQRVEAKYGCAMYAIDGNFYSGFKRQISFRRPLIDGEYQEFLNAVETPADIYRWMNTVPDATAIKRHLPNGYYKCELFLTRYDEALVKRLSTFENLDSLVVMGDWCNDDFFESVELPKALKTFTVSQTHVSSLSRETLRRKCGEATKLQFF